MPNHTIVALGRFGDIVNILPLAHHLSRQGKVGWMVSEEFAPILDGVTYAEAIPWKGEYHNTLRRAIETTRTKRMPNPIVAQPCDNPDRQQLTDSYQREAWRHAGRLNEFGHYPTVFDARDEGREKALAQEWIPDSRRPVVLVATGGNSSPFVSKFKLIALLRALDCEVVDLSIVTAVNPVDLLGLLDRADCLVSVDSLPIHLARASTCPTVSIINDGWKGSVPPPQSVKVFRYTEAEADLGAVVNAVEATVSRKPGKVIHVADIYGHTERHLRARKDWPKSKCYQSLWDRTATSIGDARPLPFLAEMFSHALSEAMDEDCILWTNDDVSFAPGAFDAFARHVARFDFGCIRRDPSHIGREAFCFRASWLRDHLDLMPDVILAVQKFDLILARWLRSFRGIPTTIENLAFDMLPVDMPPGLVIHEDHPSSWTAPNVLHDAASQHNEKLWNSN